jgi:hypothetical protein
MKRLSFVLVVCSLGVAAAADSVRADDDIPVCTPQALAALVKLPPIGLQCEDGAQLCSSDKRSSLFDPQCSAGVSAYEKALRGLVRRQWWAVPARELEACRLHGRPGTLTREEAETLGLGYGQETQGSDRIRLLVLRDACDVAGISNVLLVVRADSGLVVTPLYFAFNQGGQEDPFSLDVVAEGANTFALFTTQGHDMRNQYTTTEAYKVDLATAGATPYPLFVTARGEQTVLDGSNPIGVDLDMKDAAMIADGRFRSSFVNYTSNFCAEDVKDCSLVMKESFAWNGKAFVAQDLEAKRRTYLGALDRQRLCLQSKFNPQTAAAACAVDFACESENELAALSLRARNFEQARNHAARALDYCRGLVAGAAVAQDSYRQSLRK